MRTALAGGLLALICALPASGSTPAARILFQEGSGTSADLVTLDAAATGYRNLTAGTPTSYVSDYEGSWSPDGSRIVFTSHRDSNVSTEIYVMNSDGSNQRRLTHDGPEGVQNAGGQLFDSEPVWAPDETTIAYLKGANNSEDVWLMSPDGSDQRRITADGGPKTSLAWAPSGGRLVYESGGAIFFLVEGDPPVRIANGFEPVWSPDGSRIAYVAADGLWTIGARGGNPTHVTTMPAGGPSWSPDGTRLAFEGRRSFPELASPKFGAPTRDDLYTIRPDATDVRRLTGPRGNEYSSLPTGSSPTWWPDGSRLFYLSQRPPSGLATTYVMNKDGSCEGAFASNSTSLRGPVWRPGSQPGLGPIRCADLRVTLDLSGGAVGPSALGQASEFRFDIDNDGSETATGLRAELKASAPVEILDGDDPAIPCSGPPHDLVCLLPSLAPANAGSVAFRVRSRIAGTLPLVLSVSAFEPDSDPSTNTLVTSTKVLPCDRVGTYGDDILYGTPGRDRICALPGTDRVYGGAGNDHLDAGNGNDIVAGGPGRDVILAKGGNDTIYGRDDEKDRIDCGTERDVAIVDRLDVVRRCETVVRPNR